MVVREDIDDINAGLPFLEINDITVRPAKKEIIIKDRDIIMLQRLLAIPPSVAYKPFYVLLRATPRQYFQGIRHNQNSL